MQVLLKLTFFFTLFIALTLDAKTQGCSDAGFCSVGNLGHQPISKISQQKITVLLPAGVGDENVFVFKPAIQYDNQLNTRFAKFCPI